MLRRIAPALLPLSLALLSVFSVACSTSHTNGPDAGGRRDAGGSMDAGPPPPPGCAGLTETGCWADPTCAPIYDDDCCPTCRPIGGCADCTDPAFFACVDVEEACGPTADPCGATPSCEPLDCTDAVPDLGAGSCSVAGCVPAVEAGCLEGCLVECRPVNGGSCTASCEIVEPRCPDGMVAEADGGCYTGYCIPADVCGR